MQDAEIDRSLCPRAVADLRAWTLYHKPGGDVYCLGSLEQDKFIAVPESKVRLVLEVSALFDGNHSLQWIQDHYQREYRRKIDVPHLYRLLASANLIADPKPTHVFQGEFRRFSIDLIDMNTRAFFERLQPYAQRLFKPLTAFTLALIVLGILSFRPAFLSTDNLYLVQDSFIAGYVVLSLSGAVSLLVHEFAHAFVGSAHGVIARHIKIALYMGYLPYFYTEIAGLYTLQPRDRIKVWAAGSYSNICLGCAGLVAYGALASHLPPLAGQIIIKIALANFFRILGDLSPLMPTDGYFILSTLLKQVNIRTDAFQEFFKWMRGKENKLRGITLLYFLATSLIIGSGFIIQVRWFVGILYELLRGALGAQALESHLYFLVLALLVLVRIVLSRIVQVRKSRMEKAFASSSVQIQSAER
jgi:putative peptide zinc metalloprotease protein